MNYHNNSGLQPPYYGSPGLSPYPAWRAPVRRNANIVCFGLLLMFLLGVFLIYPFRAVSDLLVGGLGITSRTAHSCLDMLCEILTACLMFLIPLTIMRLWIGIPAPVAFPMRRPRASITVPAVFIGLCVSVAGSFVYAFVAMLLETLFGISLKIPASITPVGVAASILYFIRVALVPSVFEELLFRGVIMQSLRRFGDAFALVCSSLLFAFAHQNLAQGISGFMVGLAIGFFVLRTGSLRTGMIIHFVHNGILVISDFLTNNMPFRENNVFSSLQIAVFVVLGLGAFAYLVITHNRIFSLVPPSYPLPKGAKYRAFFLSPMSLIYMLTLVLINSVMGILAEMLMSARIS